MKQKMDPRIEPTDIKVKDLVNKQKDIFIKLLEKEEKNLNKQHIADNEQVLLMKQQLIAVVTDLSNLLTQTVHNRLILLSQTDLLLSKKGK